MFWQIYSPFKPLCFFIKALAMVVFPVPGPPSTISRLFFASDSRISKLSMCNQFSTSDKVDCAYRLLSRSVGERTPTTLSNSFSVSMGTNLLLEELSLASSNILSQKSAKELLLSSCNCLF